ncbi:GTP diphosphokinase [Oceanicoccus sagamiensis]|uniref:GTP pyrophosphokinase n=1 Tax=Oceanicoccus sagamiensis TaxID=716816 RepID=A0A1X9NDY6_9GAMM|nr:GTP diphosphokinase [Oceanicoccus sagamiensis]ARN75361.1 GTP diphosphokinase [Oceanicoccus sagamiensis]
MVTVRKQQPEKADGSVDIEQWLARLPVDAGFDAEQLKTACEVSYDAEQQAMAISDKAWDETTSSFRIGLEMAEILADLHLDQPTLVAAILYRAVREEKLSLETVEEQFGEDIVRMIKGVMRMAAMSRVVSSDSPVLGQAEAQKDNIRKMLVALVDDVRVALIKLSERTCAIRIVKNNPTKRYRVAREVHDVYAPLAHRLGIGHIKWELEDLSFRYLQPVAYKKIAKLLDEKRLYRQSYIDEVITSLTEVINRQGIEGELTGRAKHIFSIWRKMQRKGIGFSQVYDIRAVRILVPEIKDCYAVLGLVHGLWRNIPNEFDDYIANPKDNGYRSLHTAVIGPEGKVLEIQIRTFTMHEEAEFGVCAHWRYKGSDNQGGNSYEDKIAWLRQVLDWQEETDGGATEVMEHFSRAQDRVYVFTPEGHVVNLAQGSTPLDFAYHIHTEVGHRCRGAKVNGRIVQLTYQLMTGEQVEILTGKENAPRRDWLQTSLGYLKSTRARAKVQHWFKQQAREDNVAAGRALIEKIFKRLAVSSLDYKSISTYFGYQAVDDMYAAVGAGDITAAQVISATQHLFDDVPEKEPELKPTKEQSAKTNPDDISVRGVGNMLTQFASCCKPLPGDVIIGYVTLGRGVSVHRQDCANVLQLQYTEPDRIIEVSWGDAPQDTYPVEIEIKAFDRSGLLRDITTMLANARIDVIAVNTLSDKDTHTATMRLTVEITGLEALGNLLAKITRLPNVLSAERVREGN